MLKKLSKKILSLVMCIVMILSFSTIVMAAENDDIINNNSARIENVRSTIYLNDVVDFSYGSSMKSLEATIPAGSYTLYYTVTKATTLRLWRDVYTSYSYSLSGSGTTTIYVPATCTMWNCTSNYSNVTASFVIIG